MNTDDLARIYKKITYLENYNKKLESRLEKTFAAVRERLDTNWDGILQVNSKAEKNSGRIKALVSEFNSYKNERVQHEDYNIDREVEVKGHEDPYWLQVQGGNQGGRHHQDEAEPCIRHTDGLIEYLQDEGDPYRGHLGNSGGYHSQGKYSSGSGVPGGRRNRVGQTIGWPGCH